MGLTTRLRRATSTTAEVVLRVPLAQCTKVYETKQKCTYTAIPLLVAHQQRLIVISQLCSTGDVPPTTAGYFCGSISHELGIKHSRVVIAGVASESDYPATNRVVGIAGRNERIFLDTAVNAKSDVRRIEITDHLGLQISHCGIAVPMNQIVAAATPDTAILSPLLKRSVKRGFGGNQVVECCVLRRGAIDVSGIDDLGMNSAAVFKGLDLVDAVLSTFRNPPG